MSYHDLCQYVESSLCRLKQARAIADSLRHDDKLHRLAMKSVFVLEDCHETFQRMLDETHRVGVKPARLP